MEGVSGEVAVAFAVTSALCVLTVGMFLCRKSAAAPEVTPDELVNERRRIRQTDTSTPHRNDQAENCPICLSCPSLPCETNCGHIFCGECLMEVWERNQLTTSHLKCPCCRQNVSIVFTRYTAADSQMDGFNVVAQRVNAFNRRFSGAPRTVFEFISDIPLIMRHFARDLFSARGFTILHMVRVFFLVLGVVIYVLSPLDLLPEGIIGTLGLLDDLVVFLMVLVFIISFYLQILQDRDAAVHS